jgi:hypothetical protein
VLAVAEPAAVRKVEHVAERSLDAVTAGPQRDRTESGRVEQPAAVGEGDEFCGDGGVATALVVVAHFSGALHLGTDERVHQRRLPAAECPHTVDPFAGAAAHRHDRHVERDLRERGAHLGRITGIHRIQFGQHDHRPGPAVKGQHQLPLETPFVRRSRDGMEQEDGVDVGGHHLAQATGALETVAADQRTRPVEHVLHALHRGVDTHAVADSHLHADVAHADRGAGVEEHGAPPAVEARHTPRGRTLTRDAVVPGTGACDMCFHPPETVPVGRTAHAPTRSLS